MDFKPEELDRVKQQIRSLGRRDWVWISLGLLSILVVGGGLVELFFLRSPGPAAEPVGLTRGQMVAYLYTIAVVLVAFQLYTLLRSRETRRVKTELMLETLKNEVGRLNSIRDPLTKVYSRSVLEEMLEKETLRSERHGKPFSVVMIDFDRFKEVNDRFGHLTGDLVLTEIGQILRSCVRGSDFIIRYGGDEFVLLLPETDLAGAEATTHRIRQKFEEWNARNKFGRFDLTFCSGCSQFKKGKSGTELLAEADQRMYDRKRSRIAAGLQAAS